MSYKWKKAYEVLKQRILDGIYPPGSDFPTNKEIGEEFDLHTVTVQTAVTNLINEGLVQKVTTRRRTVRTQMRRSKRKGGFTSDSKGANFHKELVEVKLIKHQNDLPDDVAKTMQAPVLFYHHNQFIEDVLVANSQSYIPDLFPLAELKERLSKEGARLYRTFDSLGHKPTTVEEALVAKVSDEEDNQLLGFPKDTRIAVAKIDRKVFDADDNIIEFCKLTDRGDAYVFEYRFPMY